MTDQQRRYRLRVCQHPIQIAVRIAITLALLWRSYLETGWATVVLIGLIYITFEVCARMYYFATRPD